MAIRIVIADDDPGMRLSLRRIIESMDGFTVVGEADTGAKAAVLVAETHPDVIFLDVEMPEMTGTEAAKVICASLPDTAQIFVTAHSEYMPAAFEVYAFDYIVKPFRTDRVRQTLRRLEKSLRAKADQDANLLIKNREGMQFIPISQVIMVCREERVTQIVTADETHVASMTLSDLWPRLEGRGFIRSHRAYIVRVSSITKLYPYGRWTYTAKLRGTERSALVTHDKLDEIQRLLGAV